MLWKFVETDKNGDDNLSKSIIFSFNFPANIFVTLYKSQNLRFT